MRWNPYIEVYAEVSRAVRSKCKACEVEIEKGDWRVKAIPIVGKPDLLHVEQLDVDDKEPIRLEQEAFLQAITNREFAPEVSAREGLAALECAKMILASVRKNRWREKIDGE